LTYVCRRTVGARWSCRLLFAFLLLPRCRRLLLLLLLRPLGLLLLAQLFVLAHLPLIQLTLLLVGGLTGSLLLLGLLRLAFLLRASRIQLGLFSGVLLLESRSRRRLLRGQLA
jgi:hypothetical protein